jgi:hypothetical protein
MILKPPIKRDCFINVRSSTINHPLHKLWRRKYWREHVIIHYPNLKKPHSWAHWILKHHQLAPFYGNLTKKSSIILPKLVFDIPNHYQWYTIKIPLGWDALWTFLQLLAYLLHQSFNNSLIKCKPLLKPCWQPRGNIIPWHPQQVLAHDIAPSVLASQPQVIPLIKR